MTSASETRSGFGTGLRALVRRRQRREDREILERLGSYAGRNGPSPGGFQVLPERAASRVAAPPDRDVAPFLTALDVRLGEWGEELARLDQELDLAEARLEEWDTRMLADRGQPAAAPSRDGLRFAREHLLFVPGAEGYALVERPGPPPGVGAALELPGLDGEFVVSKLGPAPLPGDSRPCAYLQQA